MKDTSIDSLIEELKALRIRTAQLEAGRQVECTDNGNLKALALKRGNRIRITNRVRKLPNWTSAIVWEEEKERVATVTRVTPHQVHFVTGTGTRTWRAPKNVRRIVVVSY
jgi:hypothetical protein